MRHAITRRAFLALGGAAGLTLVGLRRSDTARGGIGEPPAPAPARYVSRPDLNPPRISVALAAKGSSKDAIFLAPFVISATAGDGGSEAVPASESRSGPLVVDPKGEPVWFLPMPSKTAMDFRVQTYRGRQVLTWYEGTVLGPYGGEYVVYDPTYHRVARVKAGRGRRGDLHEFLLTPRGTALITIYSEVRTDLTSIGGAKDGRLVVGIVQEVDVETGKVVFEWRSREHVDVSESFTTNVTPAGNVDYFHLNAVDVDRDGHLLISARNTCAVYKVHRRTGKVLWRLGGKRSDFRFGPGATFSFQHDARRQPDGTITIFDNAAGEPGPNVASRAIRLKVDAKARRASLVREYKPADTRAGWAMGNAQQLADGGLFVGWGTDGSFSEFGPGGKLRFDARFDDDSVSYRASRLPWTARPTGAPAVAVVHNTDATATVYVSWNGATAVKRWRVEVGPRADRLRPVVTRARTGFETAITIPAAAGYVSVVALGASGARLGASAPALL